MKTYTLGYPRIGENRELKFALERYFAGNQRWEEVEAVAESLRKSHLLTQKEKGIDLIPVNDFSYYDGMLDMIVTLGHVPERFRDIEDPVERYFAMARGDADHTALAMRKWFNTNYHYMVPELRRDMAFCIDTRKIETEFAQAKALGLDPAVRLIGPLTFLKLSSIEAAAWEELLPETLRAYTALLERLNAQAGPRVYLFDEPVLVENPDARTLELAAESYTALKGAAGSAELYVATYFDQATEAVRILCETPIDALALDFVHGPENMEALDAIAQSGKRLLAGLIDGRNVWIADLAQKARLLETITSVVGREKVSVGPSCSLLHLPYTVAAENAMDSRIRPWLAYAKEKLDEVALLGLWLSDRALFKEKVRANSATVAQRDGSSLVHDPAVARRLAEPADLSEDRSEPYDVRIAAQHARLAYPALPTTTIGSFPQTRQIRQVRRAFRQGEIDRDTYEQAVREQIDACIDFQEKAGLDVLVHGEFERNDMVEYFGEQLKGVAFSQNGWVQSYGTRCVKPPHIYGDISRPHPMTLKWITYAQSRTEKPVKGMLTGPVTMLNWSFVRDDVAYATVMRQMALAIRDEVADLQEAGVPIIQVDEAAFKEGYPLRKEKRPLYEEAAIEAFKIATAVARPDVQVHTHMCYSEFDDIIEAIEAMDADVISIETARGGNRLLEAFKTQGYTKEIGLGVYDIHSPRIPDREELEAQICDRLEALPASQVWINPDCGLKTRKWEEVEPALEAMVEATRKVREEQTSQ